MSRTMRAFRRRTLGLVDDLDDQRMIGPRLPIVNPPLWEIGHVAWFQEYWVLRHLKRQRALLENGDQVYNSSGVAHDTRWDLILPTRAATLRYMEAVLDRSIALIEEPREMTAEEFYFYVLALFHEGMHAEALAYTRQTLGYPAPDFAEPRPAIDSGFAALDDVEIPGGTFLIGATPDSPFVFDNEKWAHEVEIKPFRIARRPVTNGEFLAFVDDGGYSNRRFWSAEGWLWLESGGTPRLDQSFAKFFNTELDDRAGYPTVRNKLEQPIYWRRGAAGRWEQRTFDRFLPLQSNLPVVHLSWYEAEAYCNWAGRRLPREAEWEAAAAGELDETTGRLSSRRRQFPWGDEAPTSKRANLDWSAGGLADVDAYPTGDSAFGCRQMIGNVWEWTADNFEPFPGFTPDPYKEYSKPWFGTHKVLRGGCWATSALLIRNTWRNFYTPDRGDVWAGFRTCAT